MSSISEAEQVRLPDSLSSESDLNRQKGSIISKIVGFILVSSVLFGSAWFWLSSQLENVLYRRVDETGHQIVAIAAIASANAVATKDQLFLQELTQAIYENKLVLSAAVYQFDGTLLTQAPLKPQSDETKNEYKAPIGEQVAEIQSALTGYLPKYNSYHVPFMQEISYQNQPVGWFKVSLDRHALERELRTSSFHVTLATLAFFILYALAGLVIIFRHNQKLQRTTIRSTHCTPSVQQNVEQVPSLSNLADSIKSGRDLASNIHFTAIGIKQFEPIQSQSIQYNGLMILIAIRQSRVDSTNYEIQLEQQLSWQNIIFESCTLFELKVHVIGRSQYLITTPKNEVEDLLKLTALLRQVQIKLAQQDELLCRCSLIVSDESLLLKRESLHHSLVNGQGFHNMTAKLRALRHFAVIQREVAQQLELSDAESAMSQEFIVIENHDDKTVVFSAETVSMIERQSFSLIKKNWLNSTEEPSP